MKEQLKNEGPDERTAERMQRGDDRTSDEM